MGYAAVAEQSSVEIASVIGYVAVGAVTSVEVASVVGYVAMIEAIPTGGAHVSSGVVGAGGGPSSKRPTPSDIQPPAPLTSQHAPDGRAGYSKMRIFVGPPWRKSDESDFWDFSSLALTAYAPHAGTTVAANVGASDTSLTVTDATGWPTAGSVWLGPGASGQSWGLASYTGRTGNLLTGLVRDAVDAEYNGLHTAGAVAAFWYPLTENDGSLGFREYSDADQSAITWDLSLAGVNAPVGILRSGALVLVQTREISGGAWGSWTNWAIGWLAGSNPQDDENRVGQWSATVGTLSDVPLSASVTGLHVGERDVADEAGTSASGSLSPVYKAIGNGSGEIISENETVTPGQAIDGALATAWVSDRYYGEDNPHHTPGTETLDGIRETHGVTQAHLTRYTGQSDGYRWIEITFFQDFNASDWLIAGVDWMVPFENDDSLDYSAGQRVILAENPELFQAENPENEADAVLDLADYLLWNMYNQKYTVENDATGGTFTLTVDSQATGAIAYNATAATVQAALVGLSSVGADSAIVTGSAGALVVTFCNGLGSGDGPGLSGDGGSLTGGTLTVTQTQAGGFPFATSSDGTAIFDHLDPAQGVIRLYWGVSGQGQSILAWGGGDPITRWGTFWTGDALPVLGTAQTARMKFNPTTPTATADFWEVGRVATPGYNILAADKAWILLDLPSMGLKLAEDITDTVPGIGDELSIENVAGASVEGLPASGPLQVGDEQITYSARDTVAGSVTVSARGANGTTPVAHDAGDPVYFVDGAGVATDAYPIDTIRVRRPAGLAVPEDFVIRGSALSSARDPNQTNYTTDYVTLATVTGNVLESYSLDLSGAPPRIRYLLVEVTAMSDGPSRVWVNELDAVVDPDVLTPGANLASGTVADAIAALLAQAGLPAGCLVDAGDTISLSNYTTAGGSLWPILSDLANFSGTRIRVGRDSKLYVRKDPFWTGTPTPDGEWSRTEVRHVSPSRAVNQKVGQISLTWRSADDPGESTVNQPSTRARTGDVVSVGPYIFADETAATVAALKRYWQARRPYTTLMELAFPGQALEVGQVYEVTWAFTGRTEVRTYSLATLNLDFRKSSWQTVVAGVQIDREDER